MGSYIGLVGIEFLILIFFPFRKPVNLSSGGHDDSSSEEAQTNTHKIGNNKPIVPPRPRGISGVDYKRNGVPSSAVNGKSTKNSTENAKDIDVTNDDCK